MNSYQEYLDAVVTEAAERGSHAVRRTFDDYLDLRRRTSAVKSCLDLLLFGMEIPEDILADERIAALERLTNDMVSISNVSTIFFFSKILMYHYIMIIVKDMLSFNVEQARGDIHNIVIVLMEERNFTIQEAMDYLSTWYHEQADQFITIKSSLLSCGNKEIDACINTYAEGLANWITANYHWSFQTKRFFGDKAAEIQQHGLVELLPNKSLAVRHSV